jgi:hypothetical protein
MKHIVLVAAICYLNMLNQQNNTWNYSKLNTSMLHLDMINYTKQIMMNQCLWLMYYSIGT